MSRLGMKPFIKSLKIINFCMEIMTRKTRVTGRFFLIHFLRFFHKKTKVSKGEKVIFQIFEKIHRGGFSEIHGHHDFFKIMIIVSRK